MNIILYSTGCPKCQVLTKKLNSKSINYEICSDVSVMESKGFCELPILEVDGTTMNFSEANKWVGER